MSRGTRLLELQEVENELRDRIGAYKKVQHALDAGSPVRHAREAYELAEGQERATQTRQHDVQLDWQGLIQKLDREEKLLYSGEVRNPKELESLEMEVEMLKKQRERLEEDALNLIQEVEDWGQQVGTRKADYERIEQDQREQQATLEQQEAELKRRIGRLRKQREVLLKDINPADLEQYRYVQRLKNDTFAVAALEDGVCSACHIEASASKRDVVERAGQDRLVTCGNCGRVLVI